LLGWAEEWSCETDKASECLPSCVRVTWLVRVMDPRHLVGRPAWKNERTASPEPGSHHAVRCGIDTSNISSCIAQDVVPLLPPDGVMIHVWCLQTINDSRMLLMQYVCSKDPLICIKRFQFLGTTPEAIQAVVQRSRQQNVVKISGCSSAFLWCSLISIHAAIVQAYTQATAHASTCSKQQGVGA
jgi:hypothetical protein